MRLLYLHQYYATPRSNGGIRSYETARRLAADGVEVTMVTSTAFLPSDWSVEDGWNYYKHDGVRIWALKLPYSNKDAFLKRIVIFIKFVFFSSLKARSIPSDVVLATSTPLTIAIPGVLAARKWRAPFLFEVRDCWPAVPIALGVIKQPVLKYLAKKLEKWAYQNADKIIALSSGMQNRIEAAGVELKDIAVIPNASDIDMFHVDEAVGQDYRRQYPWLESRPLVTYTGTFGLVNNLEYLIDVAGHMKSLLPEACFLLIGTGAEEEQLREKAKSLGIYEKNLFILPPVRKNDLPSILSATDICISTVLPIEELWDNSANKFFDAFAASRPIAINHLGWQAEVIEQNNVGVVMDYSSPELGAKALARRLADKKWLADARENAASLAHNNYSRDSLYTMVKRLIEQLYAESGR